MIGKEDVVLAQLMQTDTAGNLTADSQIAALTRQE